MNNSRTYTLPELEEKAKEIRRTIVEMIYTAKSGHPGGSLSMVEMLVALYYGKMNIEPENPQWEDRDRLVLSKGHTAPAYYAVLADKGYFPREWLFQEYRKINSHLQGHPDCRKTPGVDMSAGSLGIGISTACGMALGAKRMKKQFQTYAILGDGEMNEGEVWEAAMFASFYKLDNLTVLVDKNNMQNDGFAKDVMDMGDICAKWSGFGWDVQQIDGHDLNAIFTALDAPANGKPKAIICETVKGKGVSYMEMNIKFHGGCPSEEEYLQAMKELA